MNQNFFNFEIAEVTAPTKAEAMNKLPFTVTKDATVSFNNWKKTLEEEPTDLMKKNWMIEYLTEHSKCTPGVGFIITLDPAVVDTRERPYSVIDVKNTQGKRTFSRVIQLVDSDTDKILALVEGTKGEALKVAKQMYKDGFKGNIDASVTYHVTGGEKLSFKLKYTPSKGTHDGTWLAFGIKG